MASSSHQNLPTEQQETSTNNEKSTQTPLSTIRTQKQRVFDLILILEHNEEYKRVWETQVLLPTSLDIKHICLAGPYHPHIDLETIKGWFITSNIS